VTPTEQITLLSEVIAEQQSRIGLIQAARDGERVQYNETVYMLNAVREERDALLKEVETRRKMMISAPKMVHKALVVCDVPRAKRELVEKMLGIGVR